MKCACLSQNISVNKSCDGKMRTRTISMKSLVFVDSMSLSGKRRVRNCSNHTERDTPRAATVRLGHINRPETAGDGLTRLSQSISVSPGCALVPAVGSEVAPAR